MSTSASIFTGQAGRRPSQRLRQTVELLALGVIPATVTVLVIVTVLSSHWVAYDFHWSYYPAASRLLHGQSPYAATSHELRQGVAFVYPALSAVALAPFALIARSSADHLYSLLCLLLVPCTLRLAGARDWRVYGASLVWLPVLVGWQGGNESLPLAFLAAAVWRCRDRPLVAGLMTATAVSLKPFVWPLGLWLLATRRWRAAACAFVWALIVNLLAWWIVGFDQIHAYLLMSSRDADQFWRHGYSVIAMTHYLGGGRRLGEVLLLAASAGLALAVVRSGLRGRTAEAFVLCVALMLVASPLVWSHYFALLLLPLALMRPRFSPLWLIPLAMWVCPPSTTVVGWQAGVAWGVALTCCVGVCLRPRTGVASERRPAVLEAVTLTPAPG